MICTDKRSDHNLDKTTFEWSVNHTTETLDCSTPGERIRWARRQKGWLIKTLATKTGITPEGMSIIERKAGILEMKTLRGLAVLLEQPICYLGCFETMPEDTFFEKLEKARCYHGHTKVELAAELGINPRSIIVCSYCIALLEVM